VLLRGCKRIHFCAFLIVLLPHIASAASEGDALATLQGGASRQAGAASAPGDSLRVLVHPLKVQYTADFLSNSDRNSQQIQGEDLALIQRHYQEVVTAKLAKAYPIASKPGPGVLRIDGLLLDPILDKRKWLAPTLTVFRGAPRLQLMAFLRNSQTGEVIDSVGLTLRPRANRLAPDSRGFYWHFMRRVFDRLATRVRWSLEDSSASS
jgi:hypothetical protein